MRTKESPLTVEVADAIRKYGIMLETVSSTPLEIKIVHDKLTAPRSAVLDGMPRTRNPRAGEERPVSGLGLIDAITERYKMAQVFIAWFEPMWKALSESEREILETYKHNSRHNNEMQSYAAEHNLSVSQAYRIRSKAMQHLQERLFGFH